MKVLDVTGEGAEVRSISPTLITPNLGVPSFIDLTNATGTALEVTVGNVITNADLTGAIVSTGNSTSLGNFTITELNTAISDSNVLSVDSPVTLTTQLQTISNSDPGTPDYSITATLVTPAGFSSSNEMLTFLNVVKNLQVRFVELENKLKTIGICS